MRIASIIAASVVGLLSLGLLAAGGALLWGDSKKDEQGYLTTATHRFHTQTYALASDNLDLDLDGLEDVVDPDAYGKLRLKVDPRTDAPVFVGIARTRDVTSYLDGTLHDRVEDVSFDPFSADYDLQAGTARPDAPGTQDIWDASAHGSGTQTISWDVREGDWSIVVMNDDGSQGVDAGVSVGAKLGFLAPLGWGLTIGGLLALGLAGALVVVAIRVPRREAVPA
jgi:hypothetical protein